VEKPIIILRFTINLLCLIIYLIIFNNIASYNFNRNGLIINNLLGLIIILFILQIFRITFDAIEAKYANGDMRLGANLQKNISDLFANIVFFTGIYFSILYSKNEYISILGYSLCILNILRVIKYRLIDDFRRALGKGGSYIGPKSDPVATLYQGLFNILTRSYFYIVISFTCIYLILLQGEYNNILFKFDKISGNIFVDFLYYSIVTISTVGFGDITPIDVLPKLITSIEIILGYFILTTIFSLVISIYVASLSSIAHEKSKSNKSKN